MYRAKTRNTSSRIFSVEQQGKPQQDQTEFILKGKGINPQLFCYGADFFCQHSSTAMGTMLVPSYANLFMVY